MSRGGQIGHQNFHKLFCTKSYFSKCVLMQPVIRGAGVGTVQLMLSRALNGAQLRSERWQRHSQK
jgi:hypothetical protein